jgi:signal peptidase II
VNSSLPRRWKIFLILAFVTIVADQATKYWARDALPTRPAGCEVPEDFVAQRCTGETVSVIDGFWEWRLSFNPGSAFGLFNSASGARVFLSIIGVLAVFGMLWMLKKAREDQRALIWALGLVAGGAVGNLIDRVYFGVVTDFVLWRYQTKEWPVFNVADVALVIGVGLMFIDIWGESKREKADKAKKKAALREKRRANAQLEAAAERERQRAAKDAERADAKDQERADARGKAKPTPKDASDAPDAGDGPDAA